MKSSHLQWSNTQSKAFDKEKQKQEMEEEEQAFFDRFSRYLEKKGVIAAAPLDKNKKDSEDGVKRKRIEQKDKNGNRSSASKTVESPSEVTIYKAVVQKVNTAIKDVANVVNQVNNWQKRFSSSSEEFDISDETNLTTDNFDDLIPVVGDDKLEPERGERRHSRYVEDGEIPHCSRRRDGGASRKPEEEASIAEELVRDVENNAARIYEVSGKLDSRTVDKLNCSKQKELKHIDKSFVQAVVIDDGYLTLGMHLESSLRDKIEAGDYVDLAKLLPKDRVKMEDDNRLEMVNRGGYSYWVPVAERESTPINSYNRWEQAFRVYMNIFVKAHPARATEPFTI